MTDVSFPGLQLHPDLLQDQPELRDEVARLNSDARAVEKAVREQNAAIAKARAAAAAGEPIEIPKVDNSFAEQALDLLAARAELAERLCAALLGEMQTVKRSAEVRRREVAAHLAKIGFDEAAAEACCRFDKQAWHYAHAMMSLDSCLCADNPRSSAALRLRRELVAAVNAARLAVMGA